MTINKLAFVNIDSGQIKKNQLFHFYIGLNKYLFDEKNQNRTNIIKDGKKMVEQQANYC